MTSPPPEGVQGLLLPHGQDAAVLGDVLHISHVLFQLPGDAVPLRGGDGQGNALEVHPLGQQMAGCLSRPQREQEIQEDQTRQRPVPPAEAARGQLQAEAEKTEVFHPYIMP